MDNSKLINKHKVIKRSTWWDFNSVNELFVDRVTNYKAIKGVNGFKQSDRNTDPIRDYCRKEQTFKEKDWDQYHRSFKSFKNTQTLFCSNITWITPKILIQADVTRHGIDSFIVAFTLFIIIYKLLSVFTNTIVMYIIIWLTQTREGETCQTHVTPRSLQNCKTINKVELKTHAVISYHIRYHRARKTVQHRF